MGSVNSRRFTHRCLLAIVGFAAWPAESSHATWSIVAVDTSTKEIVIGAATCLVNFDLKFYLPVMDVGIGGACAQAAVDGTAPINRRKIWDGFNAGTAPADILALLASTDPQHQSRQYGIVDVLGRAVTFTGSNTSAYANGMTGTFGTRVYAIQGNILAGAPVLIDAEAALISAAGDLPEKVMGAMEAAHARGGDGRCSCSPSAPTSCSFPPDPFTKSAHIAFLIGSRIGDTNGNCTFSTGCANGNYYLSINIANQMATDPEPIGQLRSQFDAWRTNLIGRPDAVHSTAVATPLALPANGATSMLLITLRDWQDMQLPNGAPSVTVQLEAGSPGVTTIGSVTNHGDGTYSVPITASLLTGTDRYRITANDGVRPVVLTPSPQITVVKPGEFTGDATINGADIFGFVAAATGVDLDPLHRAATDINGNSIYGDDAASYVSLLLQ